VLLATFAAAYKNDDLWKNVGALIKAGANPNVWFKKDKRNLSLLHWACISDSVPSYIMAALLRHGADTLAKDVQGKTPLHFLVKKILKFNRIEAFIRNINNGDLQAACNCPDFQGSTPMHVLAVPLSSYQDIAAKIFKLFVHIARPNIELPNMKGSTAIDLLSEKFNDPDYEPFVIEMYSYVSSNPEFKKLVQVQKTAIAKAIVKKLLPNA